MKTGILIVCLFVGFLSFGQSSEVKPKLVLELKTNAKDQVIHRIDNSKKDQELSLRKDHSPEYHHLKLDNKHERPHFDKHSDRKEVDRNHDKRREQLHDRREKHQDLLKDHKRN